MGGCRSPISSFCGILITVGGIGLGRTTASWPIAALVVVVGIALVVAGVFVTDPTLGYPPDTPALPEPTPHGTIHGLAGLVVFSTLAILWFVGAVIFARRGDRRWALIAGATGAAVAVFFVASTVVSVQDELGLWPNAPTGIFQWAAIIAGFGLISLLCARSTAVAGPR